MPLIECVVLADVVSMRQAGRGRMKEWTLAVMASRPDPIHIVHFTHVRHLSTVVQRGLLSDTEARSAELIQTEVGELGIKARRRERMVPVPPGGVVADYAPFYYAPRSPMMYRIERGGVATYTEGCDDLVYLVTTVERLAELKLPMVFTDRNATLEIAEFTNEFGRLDGLVDWPLMQERYWNDTPAQPDRKERRQAEWLVHGQVPWEALTGIVARTPACARQVLATLTTVGVTMPVVVRPNWYF